MKRLDRYIFREVLVPTSLALVALTFALVGRELSALLELIVNGSVTTPELWQLVSAILPGALTFTIPMALLIGVLTGFGRMSSDSESVAFRAAGLSTWSLLRPVLSLGLLACAVNLYLAVWATPAALGNLEELTRAIGIRQVPFAMQSRVFNEDLDNYVFYAHEVSPDGSRWRKVFLADLSTPGEPRVTVAESGQLTRGTGDAAYEVTLYNGSLHLVSLNSPERYTHFEFNQRTIPIPLVVLSLPPREPSPPQTSSGELWMSLNRGDSSFVEGVEFHRRFALPFASVVFVLIGLPLGLSTRRGGRSMGLVVSVILMLGYYLLFVGGSRFADGAQLSPFLGTWGANIVFLVLGLVLLYHSGRIRRGNRLLDGPSDMVGGIQKHIPRFTGTGQRLRLFRFLTHHPTWFRTLDLYLLRRFFYFFVLVLTVFAALFVLVTLFELLPDMVEHDATITTVIRYFIYYLPQVLYLVVPLSVLVAVFLALGTLTKANETLALKANAVSLYRTSLPLIVVASILAGGVYLMQDYVLPVTNQRQDEIRNTIKGRAPQTYRDPDKLMAGSDNRFYHYDYFDSQESTFAGLSVFTFDPASFAFQGWTYATRALWQGASWTFENGWARTVDPDGDVSYEPFERSSDRYMTDPPEYFRKEVRVASQMNYPELRTYIDDLRQSGLDVSRLSVELYRKMSFPLVSVIMAVIAIPFSFTTGRRGAFYGIGISLLIGISYWAAFELFDKLGGINQLSPLVAAWCPNLIYGFGGLWMLLKIRT